MAGAINSPASARKRPSRTKKSAVQPPAPRCDHSLQFYEAEKFLYDAVSNFILPSFFSNESASVIIATRGHLTALEVHLREQNLIPGQLKDRGQLVLLDADEILSKITPGGSLDIGLFEKYLRSFFPGVQAKFPKIRVYGELVNILCEQGNHELACQLEVAWERFLSENGQDIALLCGYHMGVFEAEGLSGVFQQICLNHVLIEPTEKVCPSFGFAEDHKTAVAMLQQKTRCLEAEITRRKMAESALEMLLSHLSSNSQGAEKALELDSGYSAYPIGVCGRTSHEGRVRYFANDKFCQISGLSEPTIRRDGNWLNAVHHLDRERVSRCFSFEDGRMRKIEYRFVHANGEIRRVSAEFTVSLSGYIHTIVDITDIREPVTQARQAHQADNYGESHRNEGRRPAQKPSRAADAQSHAPDPTPRWGDRRYSGNMARVNSISPDSNQQVLIDQAHIEVEKISKIFCQITKEESMPHRHNSINFAAISKTVEELRTWHSCLPSGFNLQHVITDHSVHPALRLRVLLGHYAYFRAIMTVTRRTLVRVATRAVRSVHPDDPGSLEVHYGNKCLAAARAICRVHDLLSYEEMQPAQRSWLAISSYFIGSLVVLLDMSLNPAEEMPLPFPPDDIKSIIPRGLETLRSSATRDPASKRYLGILEPFWMALKPPTLSAPYLSESAPRPAFSSPQSPRLDWANLEATTNWTHGQGSTIANDILGVLGDVHSGIDQGEWATRSWDWGLLLRSTQPSSQPPSNSAPHHSPSPRLAAMGTTAGATPTASTPPVEYQQLSWPPHNGGRRSSGTRRPKRTRLDDGNAPERSPTPQSAQSQLHSPIASGNTDNAFHHR